MGTAIVPFTRGRAVTRVSPANLPPAIANGIFDVLTAFAAGPQQEDADKKRLVRIYAEAVESFEAAVAEHAIGWLKLHNPRNPFRPTPQDVYETCEKLVKEWRSRIIGNFLGDGRWGNASSFDLIKSFEWGSPPLEKGCPIPEALVKQFLRDHLDSGRNLVPKLAALGRERLAKIPTECFNAGQREAALAAIETEEKHQAEIVAHNAYLESLDPDLRRHRRDLFNFGDDKTLPEDELIALARASLERERREEVRRQTDLEENNKRIAASLQPDVKAAMDRMHANIGRESEWSKALADYVAALAKHGAKPPPHLEELNARGLDP
jgi:hypothetical protein